MSDDAIRWPAAFDPARAPIHAVNRLEIAAAPDAVWRRLIRAADWPSWYANAQDVKIDGGGTDLYPNARFTWKTFGVALVSQIQEFEPTARIGWTARGLGVWVYHA